MLWVCGCVAVHYVWSEGVSSAWADGRGEYVALRIISVLDINTMCPVHMYMCTWFVHHVVHPAPGLLHSQLPPLRLTHQPVWRHIGCHVFG